ncbi:MAG: Undecaprenyl-diphosphatase [Microgenomates group bacterium GW2011_GWF2_45_18]|nr:MAG: Undecaprenyl-diphosphatase [Microgenomates group bacterium GW2011_GWF1_44_10]KKU02175.1 MAG: Undecaprenyl-diphosphatase [Microgenomates group bacterium GW2011_GWF2_45_18]HAU99331.1 hypothetical protein [Candidatus Paceibacterota bacterium]HAX01849.1 hypothetical protein [Candidatus Paceibacterota bacterium]
MQLSFGEAILLGVIEGLTEFFPISSTGHLILAERLLGIPEPSLFFNTVIQLGAICAILWFYRARIAVAVREIQKTRTLPIFFIQKMIVGTLPVAVFGFLFHSLVKYAQTQLWIIVATTLGVAGLFWIADYVLKKQTKKQIDDQETSLVDVFIIGLFQAFSIIPGVSRSGITILGGLSRGKSFRQSVDTAFMLAVPAMSLAAGYELLNFFLDGGEFEKGLLFSTAVGFLVAFFTALATISVTLPIFRKYGFMPFVIYRVILGIGIILLL